MKILLLLLFIQVACSENEQPVEQDDKPELREVYNDRLGLARSLFDDGWPSSSDCDGLLWASLFCAVAPDDVSIDLAEFSPGQWHRRPRVACYPNDEDGNGRPDSKSTISNDMLVGLMLCLSVKKDHDSLVDLWNYGRSNDWVMGEGQKADTYLKPWFQGLLGRTIGKSKDIPLYLVRSSTDYVRHVQSLAILTDTLNGYGASQGNVELLSAYSEDDYLISSILGLYTGDYEVPTEIDPPSYVRGKNRENLALAHWLLAAKINLGDLK